MNERAKFFLSTTGVAAASLAVIACATANPGSPSASAQSGGTCFLASQVNNFDANSDGTVDIQVGMDQYFRLTTDGACQNIDFRNQVGIQTTSGGDFICHGYDARFILPNAVGPSQCTITGIARLTKEQYQAARSR